MVPKAPVVLLVLAVLLARMGTLVLLAHVVRRVLADLLAPLGTLAP